MLRGQGGGEDSGAVLDDLFEDQIGGGLLGRCREVTHRAVEHHGGHDDGDVGGGSRNGDSKESALEIFRRLMQHDGWIFNGDAAGLFDDFRGQQQTALQV